MVDVKPNRTIPETTIFWEEGYFTGTIPHIDPQQLPMAPQAHLEPHCWRECPTQRGKSHCHPGMGGWGSCRRSLVTHTVPGGQVQTSFQGAGVGVCLPRKKKECETVCSWEPPEMQHGTQVHDKNQTTNNKQK